MMQGWTHGQSTVKGLSHQMCALRGQVSSNYFIPCKARLFLWVGARIF